MSDENVYQTTEFVEEADTFDILPTDDSVEEFDGELEESQFDENDNVILPETDTPDNPDEEAIEESSEAGETQIIGDEDEVDDFDILPTDDSIEEFDEEEETTEDAGVNEDEVTADILNDNIATIPCVCSVKKGDTVQIMIVDGEPTVIGVIGWGDNLEKTLIVKTYDEYAVSTSPSDIPEDGWVASTPDWYEGNYIWRRVVTEYGDGTVETGAPAVITGNSGTSGEDATVLRIDSSRGTAFKNSTVSTVLTVAIYKGGKRITDATTMRAEFGATSYLQWYWQRLDEETYGVISASDSKISQDGFAMTLTPDDVDTKVTFMCELITD